MKDTYKEVRTFRYENAVARVHIPDLTEAESAKRMEAIKKAAVELLLEPKKTESEETHGKP
jgi:hypothetical protein